MFKVGVNDRKETESYSFQMTDLIHQAFIAATSSKPKSTSTTALCAVSAFYRIYNGLLSTIP